MQHDASSSASPAPAQPRSAELARAIGGAGVAGRYALALFQAADAAGRRAEAGRDLGALGRAIDATPELAQALREPRVPRDALSAALQEVARHLALDDLVRRFVGVVARAGRAAMLPRMVQVYRRLEATAAGLVHAQVTSAHPLDDRQTDELRRRLAQRTGAGVELETRVDASLLGGLVVRLGSTEIDSSVASRLSRLGQAMKGS